MIVYGMALHTVTDIFAHAAYLRYYKNPNDHSEGFGYYRISHPDADDLSSSAGSERHEAAQQVVNKMIGKVLCKNVTECGYGSLSDFVIGSRSPITGYGVNFALGNFTTYVDQIMQSNDNNLIHGFTETTESKMRFLALTYNIEPKLGLH